MADEGLPIPRQLHLKERASDEFKAFLVILIYLCVLFGLLSIHKTLALSQRHLDYPEHAFAIINAFIFGEGSAYQRALSPWNAVSNVIEADDNSGQ
jgi:hypothetical protein